MLNISFTTIDNEFFIKRCVDDGDTSLEDVQIANLSRSKIYDIPASFLQLRNLTVCLLGNNRIMSINSILCCKHLVKLDLHGNQIETLPDRDHWSNMGKLQVLLLHDNLLSLFSCAFKLSGCPSLVALTMYDNPICVKKFYRHQIVNSIWSLKLLDKHVIADCEVIEDLRTTAKFSALHSNLYLNYCAQPHSSHVTDSKEMVKVELESVKVLHKQINKIQALCSPVIIVQKVWRGYLVRKVTKDKKEALVKKHQRLEKMKSLKSRKKRVAFSAMVKQNKFDESSPTAVTSINEENSYSTKLRSNWRLMKIECLLTEELKNMKFNKKHDTSYLLQNKKLTLKKPAAKSSSVIVTSQNSLMTSPLEELGTLAFESDRSGESVHLQAVLASNTPPLNKSLPAIDQELLRKKQRDIVKAESAHFAPTFKSRSFSAKETKRTPVNKKQPKSDPESLAILTSFIRAYSNKYVEDKKAEKINKVVRIQNEKDQQSQVVQYFNEEKRHLAVRKKIEDKTFIESKIRKNKEERLKYIQYNKLLHKSSVAKRRANRNEFTFVNDFVTQHAAVTNQIQKCKWRENKMAGIERKKEQVHNIREEAKIRKQVKAHHMESLRTKLRNFDTSIYNNNLYKLSTTNKKKEDLKQEAT